MDEIGVEIRSYVSEIRSHSHDHHQLVLPLHGRLELELARAGGCVVGGVGALIVAGERHAFHADDCNRFAIIDMPVRNGLGGLEDRADPFLPIPADVQGLLEFLSATPARLAKSQSGAWVSLVLAGLDARIARPDRAETAFRRALAFMRARLDEPIRTTDIAEAAGLSLTRLHATFQARLAMSPHAHLASLRLDAAERMLVATDLPIAEIALLTGHADQSALTRAMRRGRGRTPAKLRRLSRH